MNVQIPNEFGEFVQQLIADGVVADENEAMVEGLRLLQFRERLRRDVNLGVEQLDRGEGIDGEIVFDRLERICPVAEGIEVVRIIRGDRDIRRL